MKRPARPLPCAEEAVDGQFMGVRASEKDARFLVWPLPYEKTTSYKKGTRRGPEALIDGSWGVELWDEELDRQTYLAGIHTLPAPSMPDREPAEKIFPRLEREAARLAAMTGKTVFSIGGEHSLSQAVIPPFIRRHPGLSILHFDAHADLRPTYDGSPHNHACAMYPISKLAKIVQVGIRSIAEEEAHLVDAGKVVTYPIFENRDMKRLIPKVLKHLGPKVYISIDLDGFDPAVIPGVGTPQPGGYGWFETIDLLRTVIAARTVVGVDIMELCPLKDTVTSELAAAKLVYKMMGFLLEKDARSGRR